MGGSRTEVGPALSTENQLGSLIWISSGLIRTIGPAGDQSIKEMPVRDFDIDLPYLRCIRSISHLNWPP